MEIDVEDDETVILEGQLLLERCSENGRDWQFLKEAIAVNVEFKKNSYVPVSLWEKLMEHAGNDVRIIIQSL